MTREPESDIYDSIRGRPDIKDYYGNLPIFYALMRNDVDLVQQMYKKQRDYFTLRNYKNQSVFHIAAKHNALDALKILIDIHVFSDELVKKDYNGNTPLHLAKKKQNRVIHDFFLDAMPEQGR
jgi:ankyrin repeat protein